MEPPITSSSAGNMGRSQAGRGWNTRPSSFLGVLGMASSGGTACLSLKAFDEHIIH